MHMSTEAKRAFAGFSADSLNVISLYTIAGHALFSEWLLEALRSAMLAPSAAPLPAQGIAGALMLIGAIAAVTCSRRLITPALRANEQRAYAMLHIAVLLLALPCLIASRYASESTGGAGELVADGFAWLCAGLASSIGLSLWVNVYKALYHRRNKRTVFFMLAISPTLGCMMMLAHQQLRAIWPSAELIISAGLLLISCLLGYVCTKALAPLEDQFAQSTTPPYKALETRPWPSKLRVGIFGGCAGIALVMLRSSHAEEHLQTTCLALTFFCLSFVLLCFIRSSIIKAYRMEGFAFLMLALSFLVCTVQEKFTAASMTLFAIACFMEFTTDFNSCALTVSLKAQRYAAFSSRTFISIYAGLMAGWSAGLVLERTLDDALLCSVLSAIALAAILVEFICIPYPILEDDEMNEYLNDLPITPKLRNQDSEESRDEYWKCKCEAAAKDFGLTKREAEVLSLLARGKSANTISSQLYISYNTVKTHMYRIYKKLGINSQQELIEIMERRHVEGYNGTEHLTFSQHHQS